MIRRLLTLIVRFFSLTPAQIELREHLRRQAVREEQRVLWSCRSAGIDARATDRVLQYFRDQRNAGVPLGEATWRARRRIVPNPFRLGSGHASADS